jgi:hypothetical protein
MHEGCTGMYDAVRHRHSVFALDRLCCAQRVPGIERQCTTRCFSGES